MAAPRIPPIHCLQAFEALARLRSVTAAAEELSVTPSAVSHRMRQLETQLGVRLFLRSDGRNDFSPNPQGAAYLDQVRLALQALRQMPGQPQDAAPVTRLRLAVTPTFSRQILMPRLAAFRRLYPEVELVLQVAIPLLDVKAGPFEHQFERADEVLRVRLIRSPLVPWGVWFTACGIQLPEPREGAQFNDVGLMLDAAAAGFGVSLTRGKLAADWLDSGRLVRLSPRNVVSPFHHYLCWRPGTLERWECAAFVDWLSAALG